MQLFQHMWRMMRARGSVRVREREKVRLVERGAYSMICGGAQSCQRWYFENRPCVPRRLRDGARKQNRGGKCRLGGKGDAYRAIFDALEKVLDLLWFLFGGQGITWFVPV